MVTGFIIYLSLETQSYWRLKNSKKAGKIHCPLF